MPLGKRHSMVEFHLVRIFEGVAACFAPSLLPFHEEGLVLRRHVHSLGHLKHRVHGNHNVNVAPPLSDPILRLLRTLGPSL